MDALRTLLATRWGRLCWEPATPEPEPVANVDQIMAELGFDPPPAPPEGAPPLVSFLGPVEIDGWPVAGDHPWKYAKTGELVAYLALEGRPVNRHQVMEALWPGEPPDDQRLNRVVSDARRKALGPDGKHWLPRPAGGMLELTCVVDWGPGREWPEGRDWLEWVRGPVFDTGGLDWLWASGWRARAEVEVAAEGLRVGRLELGRGNWRRALWAARKGLCGDPWSVELVGLVGEAGLVGEDAGWVVWAHTRLGELIGE